MTDYTPEEKTRIHQELYQSLIEQKEKDRCAAEKRKQKILPEMPGMNRHERRKLAKLTAKRKIFHAK